VSQKEGRIAEMTMHLSIGKICLAVHFIGSELTRAGVFLRLILKPRTIGVVQILTVSQNPIPPTFHEFFEQLFIRRIDFALPR